jgi:hypothetical protein
MTLSSGFIARSNSSAHSTGDYISLWRSAGLRPQSSESNLAIKPLKDTLFSEYNRGMVFAKFISIDCGGNQPNATCWPKATRRECLLK